MEVDPSRIVAVTGCFGDRSVVHKEGVGRNAVLHQAVRVRVLLTWEGCNDDIIDPKKGMTWQLEEQFVSGEYREFKNLITDMKTAFSQNTEVKQKQMTWASKAFWNNDHRTIVICRPGYEWVKNHPSIKTRLQFENA